MGSVGLVAFRLPLSFFPSADDCLIDKSNQESTASKFALFIYGSGGFSTRRSRRHFAGRVNY